MASPGDDDDTVLSDVEEESDEPIPITIDHSSDDRFRQLQSELDRERKAREAAEVSKSELQLQFNRLKALAHEAIKKRDESTRQKDEALEAKEKVLVDFDEVSKQRDELVKQMDEIVKAKDAMRSEVETAAHMLITGIDKISGKVGQFKNFAGGGLPRSHKYTGLPAVAYGVVKRTNEIVEELVRQIETVSKSRDQVREQIEHRNYEIAIEVSQLEATISGLRDDVAKKSSILENLEGNLGEKDAKIMEIEKQLSEKVVSLQNENSELKQLATEYDDKCRSLEDKMETQRPLLVAQLNLVSNIHERIYEIIKALDDDDNFDQSEFSQSLFLPQETDNEENIRACLAGMESIVELSRMAVVKTCDVMNQKSGELKSLNETVDRLVKEKEHIGSLLRGALSSRMVTDPSSKKNDLFQVAENGLREAGIDYTFSKVLGEDKADAHEMEDEIYTLAGALEKIVKASQLEIIELQHSVEQLRAESSLLKERVEAQAKELNQRIRHIEELEEKERAANENVEGLMTDIAAAEEEINRWKVAAEQEAAAGRGIEQEFVSQSTSHTACCDRLLWHVVSLLWLMQHLVEIKNQLSALKQDLVEAKHAMLESEKKLKYKEETANAAMTARDAAEKSLRLADLRANRLRDRVEELSRQLEEFETREDSTGRRRGPRYVCWPWQWLGMDFVGIRKPETEQQNSNEMELSEPLL
ncbi:hypothetical protein ACFE04_024997 [Oxalis oulophora]